VLIKEQVVQALRSGSFTVVHILLTIAAAPAFEQELPVRRRQKRATTMANKVAKSIMESETNGRSQI